MDGEFKLLSLLDGEGDFAWVDPVEDGRAAGESDGGDDMGDGDGDGDGDDNGDGDGDGE